MITPAQAYVLPFTATLDGQLQGITLAYARSLQTVPATLYVRIAADPGASQYLPKRP
jgi:hypothetical protein